MTEILTSSVLQMVYNFCCQLLFLTSMPLINSFRMQRKKGQFAPRSSEDSVACDVAEESGQIDNPPETS